MKTPELRTMRRKNVSAEEFMEYVKRIDPGSKITLAKVYSLRGGEFLAAHRGPRGGWTRLHLKKIWITPYELSYRNTKTTDGKARVGKEIFISSFPLPSLPVDLRPRQV